MRLAKKAGFRQSKTAVGRELTVILHATWKNGAGFRWRAAKA